MALNHSCSVRPSRLRGAPSRILLFFHSTSKNFRRLAAPLRQLTRLVFFFFLPAEPGREGNYFLIPRKLFFDVFFSRPFRAATKKKSRNRSPSGFSVWVCKGKNLFFIRKCFFVFFPPLLTAPRKHPASIKSVPPFGIAKVHPFSRNANNPDKIKRTNNASS